MNLDRDDDSDDALLVLRLKHAGHDVQIPADAGMSEPESLALNGAVQLGIQGDEHLAQPAPRVGPEQAEPLAVAGGPADRQAAGAVGVVIIVGLGRLAVLGA